MILTDIHTHSTWSADGRSTLKEMAEEAQNKGVGYFGVSEHFDYDYLPLGLLIKGEPAHTDAEGYFAEGRALKEKLKSTNLLLGCEMGYSDDLSVSRKYAEIIEKFKPDFVVNSVHTCDGYDCWFDSYFEGKDKLTAYKRYLERVKQSLSAPYRYDIVGHIGYVSRNAPYADPKIRYDDFADLFDSIFKEIIERGKILEVNSSSRSSGSRFLPDRDALVRYHALGGRKVSFASDAHSTDRICDRRDDVVLALKEIGFSYITIPTADGEIEVDL